MVLQGVAIGVANEQEVPTATVIKAPYAGIPSFAQTDQPIGIKSAAVAVFGMNWVRPAETINKAAIIIL